MRPKQQADGYPASIDKRRRSAFTDSCSKLQLACRIKSDNQFVILAGFPVGCRIG
jgi:hypothetical protein